MPTRTTYLDAAVRDFLIAHKGDVVEVRFCGGDGAISPSTRTEVMNALR